MVIESDTPGSTRRCPSCTAKLRQGVYCPRCGQHQRRGRLTAAGVLRTFFSEVLSLEKGLGHTWLGLSRRPGVVVRDYVEGRTIRYTPPVRYFLIGLGLAQLVALWTGSISEFSTGLASGIAEPENPALSANSIGTFLDRYFVLLSALLLPLLVWCSRLTLRRSPENSAEHAVFHLYTQGHLAWIFGLILLVATSIPEKFAGFLMVGFIPLSLAYYLGAAASFFHGTKLRSVLGALAAMLLATLSYFSLLAVALGLLLKP